MDIVIHVLNILILRKTKMEPNAHRPLYMEYVTVGKVLRYWAQDFYKITENQFIDHCMKESGGTMSAFNARIIYKQLMEEAGLK